MDAEDAVVEENIDVVVEEIIGGRNSDKLARALSSLTSMTLFKLL
jgi:hypothetical protein